jgi:Ca2+-binding EF-hand superfamily protein
MLKTTLMTAAVTLTLAGAAAAQDARPTGRMDADSDGRISLSEMQAASAARFARLDVNRDGQLTREERRAGRQIDRSERQGRRAGREAAAFTRRDADRDGAITETEAPRAWERLARFDANRDARLTVEEIRAGREALRAERQGSRAERPAQAGRLAKDADGVLTRAEAEARVRARFAMMDVNRDGYVTREERQAHRQARRGQA